MINPLVWAKVRWRERQDRVAEKKASRAPLPTRAAPLLWCVLLTMVGVAALAGSTWMLLIFIAGSVGHIDWTSNYAATEAGVAENQWAFQMSVHWTVAIGLFLFCCAIAIFNATWLEARKHLHGAIRTVVTTIGVVVALFMISGAIVVQQRGTDARARDDVVAAQTAQVGAATAQARLTRAESRLREMRNHEHQYMAVAATVGAAEFERSYLSPEQRARETPDRLRLLERSLGAARQADALEAEIAQIQGEVAAAQTTAVAAEAVTVRAAGFMSGPVAILEDARKPLTATLGELLALTAFGFALAAWRSRRSEGYGSIPQHRYMIPDMKDSQGSEPSLSSAAFEANKGPMDANYKGDVIFDEQGREMRWVEGYVREKDRKWIPGHYRLTGAKRRREIEVTVPQTGETFTARYAEEKDGRLEVGSPPSDSAPNHVANIHAEAAADRGAEVSPIISASDNSDDGDQRGPNDAQEQLGDSEINKTETPDHPEPSIETNAALDDLIALEANEPEYSTAAVEEITEPALIADESDAVAEGEEHFQPRAFIGAK